MSQASRRGPPGWGERVLDLGAGSGVLSIAAALLGASEVVAVEGDSLAWGTIEENLARNRVNDRVELRREWANAESLVRLGPFEAALANLEAGLLLPLLPSLAEAVGPSGRLVLSGLLESEVYTVLASARGLGLQVVTLDVDGEWRSLLLGAGSAAAALSLRDAAPVDPE